MGWRSGGQEEKRPRTNGENGALGEHLSARDEELGLWRKEEEIKQGRMWILWVGRYLAERKVYSAKLMSDEKIMQVN